MTNKILFTFVDLLLKNVISNVSNVNQCNNGIFVTLIYIEFTQQLDEIGLKR